MQIEPIPDGSGEFEKVYLHTDFPGIVKETPHCINHGAMNKVSASGLWRCCIAESVLQYPKSTKEERHAHRMKYQCKAGCQESKQE